MKTQTKEKTNKKEINECSKRENIELKGGNE